MLQVSSATVLHMNPDWQDFLQQQGARFAHDQIVRFGDASPRVATQENTPILADLSGSEGLIEVTGPERHKFLQGQLSTDLRQLTPELSQFSSWNNAKGRVVTTLRVFEHGEGVILALPQALCTPVTTRLRLFVLRAKVQLSEVSDQLARFGITGDEAPHLLAACGCAPPQTVNSVTQCDGIQLIRLHGTAPRIAIHGEPSLLKALWTKLEQQSARPVGSDHWTLLRILAGEPHIHPATSGHFVAQTLGLEELGAVHFNKGCYLGQEVIARTHYRGAVKRHLHRGSCDTKESVLPAMEIQDPARQLTVGEVVEACRDTTGIWHLLAVLQDAAGTTQLQVQDAPINWAT